MCDAIKKEFPNIEIRYAFWHKDIGKGIDDYINNSGSTKGISYVGYQEAGEISNKAFGETLKLFGVEKLQDLKDSDVVPFENTLQKSLEARFVK